MQTIGPPVRLDDGLGDGATGLLVKKRHPVRKTQKTNRLVLLRDKVSSSALFMRFLLAHIAARVDFNGGLVWKAIGDADFHLEGVATVGCGRPRGDGVKIRLQFLVQPFQERLLADRDNAVGPRRQDARFLNSPVQRGRLCVSDMFWIGASLNRLSDCLRASSMILSAVFFPTQENSSTRNRISVRLAVLLNI